MLQVFWIGDGVGQDQTATFYFMQMGWIRIDKDNFRMNTI
jgi:hypothetical protein